MLRHVRTVRFLDGGLVLWTVLWLALGTIVGIDVVRIGNLSDTVSLAATTLDATASTLSAIGHIPFVGGQVSSLADQVRATAQSTHDSAIASRQALDQLAVVLGVSVGFVPTLPLIVLYLPMRLGWRRDIASVRAAYAAHGDDPAFTEFLARRAVENLPYRRVLEITPNPWLDIRESRTDGLARAELVRLGIERDVQG